MWCVRVCLSVCVFCVCESVREKEGVSGTHYTSRGERDAHTFGYLLPALSPDGL